MNAAVKDVLLVICGSSLLFLVGCLLGWAIEKYDYYRS